MREYETIVVTRPDSAESETGALLDRVSGIIESHEGTIFQKKDWGRRTLAYPIRKHKHGNYYYYNYAAGTAVVAELERVLKLTDVSLRYLTVKMADKVDVEARKSEMAATETAAALAADAVQVTEEVKDA